MGNQVTNTAYGMGKPEEKQEYGKSFDKGNTNYGNNNNNDNNYNNSYNGNVNSYNNATTSTTTYSVNSNGSNVGGSNIDGVIDFGEKVVISYNFWKDNVDMLERSKQQQLGVLLFANLFKKQPLCRSLFSDSDISKQSLRLLDMFGWLLRSLVKEKNQMRVRTLKSLGDRHVKYGIKIEFFHPMLDSLSEALQDHFGTNYNSQTRVALTTLFQSACNEMMKQAGKRPPFARLDVNNNHHQKQHIDQQSGSSSQYRWLRSLDHCLADPMGFSALEQYLSKTYQSELIEFHKAYRIYRCCLTPRVRKEIAHEICKLFLTPKAQFELNDSGDNKKKIHGIMQKCDELQLDYPIDLFDESHIWVKFQISQNAWMKFKIMIQSTQ